MHTQRRMLRMAEQSEKRVIDYYIFVDYSDYLIGYNIIERQKLNLILPKIVKFRHYKEEMHKKIYLLKIRREIKSLNLVSLFLRQKIMHIKDNLLLFAEIIEFVSKNDNCLIFMSVDNNQFNAFIKLLNIVPHKEHLKVVKESDLKRRSVEHQLSLEIDTMLNIERMSK